MHVKWLGHQELIYKNTLQNASGEDQANSLREREMTDLTLYSKSQRDGWIIFNKTLRPSSRCPNRCMCVTRQSTNSSIQKDITTTTRALLRFAKDMAQRVDSHKLWQKEIAFYLPVFNKSIIPMLRQNLQFLTAMV